MKKDFVSSLTNSHLRCNEESLVCRLLWGRGLKGSLRKEDVCMSVQVSIHIREKYGEKRRVSLSRSLYRRSF